MANNLTGGNKVQRLSLISTREASFSSLMCSHTVLPQISSIISFSAPAGSSESIAKTVFALSERIS